MLGGYRRKLLFISQFLLLFVGVCFGFTEEAEKLERLRSHGSHTYEREVDDNYNSPIGNLVVQPT